MKHTKTILFLSFFLSLFIGCKEKDGSSAIEVNKLPTFADYYKQISQKTDGKVIVQSTIGLGSQHETRNNSVDTHFSLTQSKISRTTSPSVAVNGKSVGSNFNTKDNSRSIEELFGTNANVEITESLKSGRSESTQGSVYIPELLTVQGKIESLREGDQITWNADSKNENGVTFKLEYKPQTQSNKSVAEKFTSNILNAFIVEDNGRLTITSDMISKFPTNSDINLVIARGNMDLVSGDNSTDYSVGGVTAVYTRARIVR